MNLKHLTFAAVISIILLDSVTSEDKFYVGLKSSYCTKEERTVTCDFGHTTMPVVYENDEDPRNYIFDTLYIKNAQELDVTVAVCKILHIINIDNVSFANRAASCRGNVPGFYITNAKVNELPRHALYIYIYNSEVGKIDNIFSPKKFVLSKSVIGELKLEYAIYEIHGIIEDTVIDKLIKVKLDKGAHLTMTNATINDINKNGLLLLEGVANIWNSNIQGSVDSIVISEESNLSLKDNLGAMYVTSLKDKSNINKALNNERRPPGVPNPNIQKHTPPSNVHEKYPKDAMEKKHIPPSQIRNESLKSEECQEYSPLVWLIPTLIALVETLILLRYCCKSNKRHKSEGPEEEGAVEAFSISVGHDKTMYNAFKQPNVRRRPN